jgi:RNA polymerase sigma-70 factor (ECF subfamily)
MSAGESANNVRRSKAEERRRVEAAQRDLSCFAALYGDYFEIVYAYVARRVRNRAAAEDLTAEVFHRALRSLHRFKWTGAPFAAWLFRIASNLIADLVRREKRESTAPLESSSLEERSASEPNGPGVIALENRPQQDDLEEIERHALLFHLVNELGEDQRRVLVLRFAEEMSIREIADELGRSEGAVKQLQFRGLKNLRAKLAGEAVGESKR